ncbi:TPR-like protein [Panus rudis PR-1116 ss-1]|nr:TPR-like protein [Panus rudis PR-1116 ss-1]
MDIKTEPTTTIDIKREATADIDIITEPANNDTFPLPYPTFPYPLEYRLTQRTAQRQETATRKKAEAELLKEEGNNHYRSQRWAEAASCYERAIMIYGPRATYMSNLAATYLKLQRYEEAEEAATEALKRNPKEVKARYRRAMAKKARGLLFSAITDLQIILHLDPTNPEAKREFSSIREELGADSDDDDPLNNYYVLGHYNGPDRDGDDADQGYPLPSEEGYETPYLSDSYEFQHRGNDVPCRFYNHDGCYMGVHCRFSHAPDDRSIRDKLGRNVCLYHILDLCKFGDEKCNYCHDKTYLPAGPWDRPGWITLQRDLAVRWGASHDAKLLKSLAWELKKPAINAESFLPRKILQDQ